ncbi:ROK family transcriptional regulator [Cellulomonas sp. H30R-01]|uniref:ROK family transcriptional regulator n=1 Tax=Cellulomonas sp. H30R-01 TaxID=2704467 RepID=UPI00138C3545|nr:ROK family transcriptional regulator [Cellulomonas sp. H30R-01]QHT54664.1 ROK family transcriptional regulator [Cellulomonas sp. H30R-01]
MAGSQSSLREANRSAVVETVKRHGGLTQVELVGATGLSPATVSTIVKQLVSDGVVEVRTTIRTGRRAQLVTLAHRVGLAVGVHVGHRHIRVAIADFTHEVLAERVLPMPVDHPVDTSLDRTALLVVDLLERLGLAMQDVVGIGIGLPAPVDDATGMISVRGIMRGWDEVHVGHVLSKRLALPVYVDNDANLGALAESTRGASREYRDSVYVRASYGTGAGIIINHQLHRGFAGTAGEIGHVQVDPQGDICRCGSRGCLDTVVGARAIVEPLRATHGNLTLRDVVQRAREGDPGCAQVIADAGAEIGAVVSGVAMTVNPQCVVVGGELAETGEILLRPMREALRRRVLLNQIAPLEVIPAELGNAAEVAGAIALVMQHADVDLDPPVTAQERADA